MSSKEKTTASAKLSGSMQPSPSAPKLPKKKGQTNMKRSNSESGIDNPKSVKTKTKGKKSKLSQNSTAVSETDTLYSGRTNVDTEMENGFNDTQKMSHASLAETVFTDTARSHVESLESSRPASKAGEKPESKKKKKTKSKQVEPSDAPVPETPKAEKKKAYATNSIPTLDDLERQLDTTLLPQTTNRSAAFLVPQRPSTYTYPLVDVESITVNEIEIAEEVNRYKQRKNRKMNKRPNHQLPISVQEQNEIAAYCLEKKQIIALTPDFISPDTPTELEILAETPRIREMKNMRECRMKYSQCELDDVDLEDAKLLATRRKRMLRKYKESMLDELTPAELKREEEEVKKMKQKKLGAPLPLDQIPLQPIETELARVRGRKRKEAERKKAGLQASGEEASRAEESIKNEKRKRLGMAEGDPVELTPEEQKECIERVIKHKQALRRRAEIDEEEQIVREQVREYELAHAIEEGLRKRFSPTSAVTSPLISGLPSDVLFQFNELVESLWSLESEIREEEERYEKERREVKRRGEGEEQLEAHRTTNIARWKSRRLQIVTDLKSLLVSNNIHPSSVLPPSLLTTSSPLLFTDEEIMKKEQQREAERKERMKKKGGSSGLTGAQSSVRMVDGKGKKGPSFVAPSKTMLNMEDLADSSESLCPSQSAPAFAEYYALFDRRPQVPSSFYLSTAQNFAGAKLPTLAEREEFEGEGEETAFKTELTSAPDEIPPDDV
ncbi:hypothetical protein BLNAU_14078 [Blattamonas nauphoetae]|uniref:Uncharacterized protein n=1 Tax=Blattamonas nauphoetae TaxID=2049346 RepID=A0ABQ9XIG3_9EUKA|nr:hypothetical protein BLNAU_14078 [Blattamonas nauphoetae]